MPSGSNPSPQGKKQTRGERNKMKKMHREKKRRRHKPIDSIQSRTIPVSHNFDFLSTGRAAFVGKNHIHSYSNEQNYLYIGLNSSWDQTSTLFIFYKNLVYKNIKAWNCSKIKNIVVISLVAISISFEGFG